MEHKMPNKSSASRSLKAAPTGIMRGIGDEKLKSHIEDKVQRYLKSVADKTFKFFQEKSFNHLILVDPKD